MLVHRIGDVVDVPSDEYHTVDAVEPNTATRMVCGALVASRKWGYLDPATGRTWNAPLDPDFLRLRAEINPHMRPK